MNNTNEKITLNLSLIILFIRQAISQNDLDSALKLLDDIYPQIEESENVVKIGHPSIGIKEIKNHLNIYLLQDQLRNFPRWAKIEIIDNSIRVFDDRTKKDLGFINFPE